MKVGCPPPKTLLLLLFSLTMPILQDENSNSPTGKRSAVHTVDKDAAEMGQAEDLAFLTVKESKEGCKRLLLEVSGNKAAHMATLLE